MANRGSVRRDLILFFGGSKVPLESRDELMMSCVDSSGRLCWLILPSSALRNDVATACSYKHGVPVAVGCVGINTESTLLRPVAIKTR
jgi:hypothetical protein